MKRAAWLLSLFQLCQSLDQIKLGTILAIGSLLFANHRCVDIASVLTCLVLLAIGHLASDGQI